MILHYISLIENRLMLSDLNSKTVLENSLTLNFGFLTQAGSDIISAPPICFTSFRNGQFEYYKRRNNLETYPQDIPSIPAYQKS